MEGAGKYDEECSLIRRATQAKAAIVLVIGGKNGSGFSVQSYEHISRKMLASILESMAKKIREGEG